MNRKLAGLSKSINAALTRQGCNYTYDRLISMAFNGEGFYVNHREKVLFPKMIWAHDIHWAYGGALLTEKFPLSSFLCDKPSELAIYTVSISKMEPRYEQFYYTLYKHQCKLTLWNNRGHNEKYLFYMTNLDWPIFNDLYISDAKIERIKYFQDVGYLTELRPIVDRAYIDKHNSPAEEKATFEAAFYGMFAKKLNKDIELKHPAYQIEVEKAIIETDYEDVRNKRTPIAMFQTAYLRQREWKNFKKYMDSVVYMNTDSIYTDKPIGLPLADKIGEYDLEFNKPVQFIRRNAYLVLEDDYSTVYKSVIGGCIDHKEDFTPEKIQALRDGETVKAHTKTDTGIIKEIDLQPLFILEQL